VTVAKGRRRRPPLPLGGRGAQRGGCNPGAQPDFGGRHAATKVWLFDLDNTLHDASHAAFAPISEAMTGYIVEHIGLAEDAATALRQHYWKRYGATLLGMVRHHQVHAAHFLEQTHRLPGLEERVRSSAHDRAALRRLRGRRYVLTNAPRRYALRVLRALGLASSFDAVLSIEDMAMFGELRPKPDTRMLRALAARLGVSPARCVLVEDTLVHQKAARRLGMTTVWMQRYLGGRFRGGPGTGGGAGSRRAEVGVHRCPSPLYVCAKIKSLQSLHRL
jgi:putative hydrolase of the HAD superfamily